MVLSEQSISDVWQVKDRISLNLYGAFKAGFYQITLMLKFFLKRESGANGNH